jgi:hypothetical protein
VARLGQVGYVAKGVALGVVGGLLSYATLTFDPQKAQGLDGALQTILAQPFGRFLLTAVALGFLAFGADSGVMAHCIRRFWRTCSGRFGAGGGAGGSERQRRLGCRVTSFGSCGC